MPRGPEDLELCRGSRRSRLGGCIARLRRVVISRAGRIAAGAGVMAVAIVAAAVVGVMLIVPLSSERARERFVAVLADRLDAEVELDELRVHMLPSLRAEGRGLTIRHRGRRDVPPLISIAHFSAESSVTSLLHRHISRVDIDGLDIEIPPDRNRDALVGGAAAPDAGRDRDPVSDPARTFVIDRLSSTAARLTIIPKEAGKAPKVWDIHDLRLLSVSTGTAMPFVATLDNAVPPGAITTRGTFGPWASDEPGRTPLDGVFTFSRADLSVFNGISGLLAAHGQFGGRLDRIDIHGETDTPEFRVSTGLPVPLHARYHAIVDGTNGNTILDEVDASFLNTSILAKGSVAGEPNQPGRTVSLDVTMSQGRLEDVLRLAVKAPRPPMIGGLRLTTRFVLPPGDDEVVRKLRLDGRFTIAGTRFTDATVQDRINELSHRGSGKVREAEVPRVASRFEGSFKLGAGRLEIPNVTFDVPGSLVDLAGTYDLVPETLNFKGTLYMDAKVSDTTTGIKHLLLKLADPFFKRDGGGSAIPIKVTGRRSDPSFGLDKGRLFSKKD
jgi:AsmA-like C-terminal region